MGRIVRIEVEEGKGKVRNSSEMEVGVEMVKIGKEWVLMDVYLNRLRFEEEVRKFGSNVICFGDHIGVWIWLGIGEEVNLEEVVKGSKKVCGLRVLVE